MFVSHERSWTLDIFFRSSNFITKRRVIVEQKKQILRILLLNHDYLGCKPSSLPMEQYHKLAIKEKSIIRILEEISSLSEKVELLNHF